MTRYDGPNESARTPWLRLAFRVTATMMGISAATIVLFAFIYRVIDAVTPGWGFLASVAAPDTPVRSIGELLTYSMYIFFHSAGPSLLTAHGPDRVVVGIELALSWGWLVLLIATTVERVSGPRRR